MRTNLGKTLTELEKKDWSEPNYDSHLVTTCHNLRKKPLKDFSTEDLRIMIGQNISLTFLIPIAIQQLTENILTEGDFYTGDLLKSVLDSDGEYWKKNKVDWQKVMKLYKDNETIFESYDIHRQIRRSFERFSNIDSKS